jgi:thioredoxin-dependent peroxiredoxin
VSFDTSADNKAFKDTHDFAYPLLSDIDRSVGAAYEVMRAPDHAYANYPERYSYLIDPEGLVRKAYDVKDPAAHGAEVLTDMAEFRE